MSTSVDVQFNSLARAVTDRSNKDRQDIQKLSQGFNAKKSALDAAIASGDQGQIILAQNEFEREAQKLKAKSEEMSVVNRIINSIIDKIGQIGR